MAATSATSDTICVESIKNLSDLGDIKKAYEDACKEEVIGALNTITV